VRGNEAFAYSWHKRLVEEMLARYRSSTRNCSRWCSASAPSSARRCATRSPPVREAAPDRHPRRRQPLRLHLGPGRGRRHAARPSSAGHRHLQRGRRRRAHDPRDRREAWASAAWCCRPAAAAALRLLKALGLTQYGPEQVDFLRYRPVLDNRRLKREFGYVPQLSSAQVFDLWRKSRSADGACTLPARRVVVTGAAGGLGAALCRRFAAAGARIVALDRDAAGCRD
jgi:UDP-glucose 4-epimerase